MGNIDIAENGYTFVSRAGWDASVDFPSTPLARSLETVYIHHTVTPATASPCNDAQLVERVLDQRRLDGYNFLFHPSGTVLEFAGQFRGEHTGGRNATSYGFSFIGNFQNDQPTLAALIAASRTLNLLRLNGALHPALERIAIREHGEVKPTACPGHHLRNINGRSVTDWIRWFAHSGS